MLIETLSADQFRVTGTNTENDHSLTVVVNGMLGTLGDVTFDSVVLTLEGTTCTLIPESPTMAFLSRSSLTDFLLLFQLIPLNCPDQDIGISGGGFTHRLGS